MPAMLEDRQEEAGQDQEQGNHLPQQRTEGKGQLLVGGVGALQVRHQHDVAHEVIGGLRIGNLTPGAGLKVESSQREVSVASKDLKSQTHFIEDPAGFIEGGQHLLLVHPVEAHAEVQIVGHELEESSLDAHKGATAVASKDQVGHVLPSGAGQQAAVEIRQLFGKVIPTNPVLGCQMIAIHDAGGDHLTTVMSTEWKVARHDELIARSTQNNCHIQDTEPPQKLEGQLNFTAVHIRGQGHVDEGVRQILGGPDPLVERRQSWQIVHQGQNSMHIRLVLHGLLVNQTLGLQVGGQSHQDLGEQLLQVAASRLGAHVGVNMEGIEAAHL